MSTIHAFRLACVQMNVTEDKAANISHARQKIEEAAKNGAKLIVLPECFTCPYGTEYYEKYAEPIPGETTQMLSEVAKETWTFVVGGAFPERQEDGKIFITSPVFGPDGNMIAKYNLMHLFDSNSPGKMQESSVLSPGHGFCSFDTPTCKVGVGICYDLRFPELAHIYAKQAGCNLLVYLGVWSKEVGKAHFELLLRSRAVDEQVYVAGCSPARNEAASFPTWGHSAVVNPWGEVIAKADDTEQIIYADIDHQILEECRKRIPVQFQKRHDLYNSAYVYH